MSTFTTTPLALNAGAVSGAFAEPQREAETPAPLAEPIARKFVAEGGHVIFFARGTKNCQVPGWHEKATNDLATAVAWAQQDPYANVGLVGKQNGLWALDIDDESIAAELYQLAQQRGAVGTYCTNTVSGGVHLIFRQNAASWEMGNVSITDENKAELLSARVNNRYVVLAGSWAYPDNDQTKPLTQYTAINPDAPIVEAPAWLLEFIKAKASNQKKKSEPSAPAADKSVVTGGRNNHITSFVGRMRYHFNWDYEKCKEEALAENQRVCVPPLDDDEVISIVNSSFNNYKGGNEDLTFNQKSSVPLAAIEQDEITIIPYPSFPRWVMEGTSIYKNLVKPVCEVNSRYPEFMWVPAMALLLNYIGCKVKVEMRSDRCGIFLVLIGTKGQTIKSSSVEDVMAYFNYMGCLAHANKDMKTAEGRSVVWTIGSTEGLGIEMQKSNCKNAVLFFDEFKLLTDKSSIESSSMKSHLLSLYEQGKFSNSTKKGRDSFEIEPNSYVATLIACTTPKNFHDLWSTFAYGAEGMDDRFFFLLEPEHLQELQPQTAINTMVGSQETKRLIDKAINTGVLRMSLEAAQLLRDSIKSIGNRPSQRAEKWARAIAIDMGLEEINLDAVRRGIALTEYELGVKKYLDVRGANSKLAAAQLKLCQILQRQPGGRMPYRTLYSRMRGDSYDTKMWFAIYGGLQQAGRIREDGANAKGDPKYVTLLRALTEEE